MDSDASYPESASGARAYDPSPSGLLVLQPGETLETDVVIVQAMRQAETVEVTCSCSLADPDRPRCERVTEIDEYTTRVTCVPKGGCSSCSTKVTSPSRGLVIAQGSNGGPPRLLLA